VSINSTPSYRDFIEGRVIQPVVEENAKTNTTAQDRSIPVVYGLQRVTPPRIFTAQSDFDTSKLIVVYALSEGPCYGIYRLFVNSEYVETDQGMSVSLDSNQQYNGIGTANTIRTPTGGTYYNISRFEYRSGWEEFFTDVDGSTSTDYTHKLLAANIADQTKIPKFGNVSLLICEFQWINDGNSPFSNIPEITVDLFGKLCQRMPIDTRWDWTTTSVANQTAGAGTSVDFEYSTNPALQLRDYLSSTTYGAGIEFSSIDETSFTTAQNYFDGNINVNLSNGQLKITKKYTSNVVVNTENSVLSNVETMLNNNFAFMPFVAGKFRLINEEPGTPEVTVTENSIVDQIRFSYPDATSRYNSINYTFNDAERDFVSVRKRFPVSDADVQTLIDADDGNINTYSLNLPSITDPYMAERIAKQMLNKSRESVKITWTAMKDLYQYQVGDHIQITTNLPSVSTFECRIVEMRLRDDDLIDVVAYSHQDDFYQPFVDFVQQGEDYKKPLIPVSGGVLIPSNPTDPISVTPPTTPNPGPGEPGNPGAPDETPISPVQPGEPLPPKPQDPVYLYNSDNVYNHANITTIGNKDQYYLSILTNTSQSGYDYEPDADYWSTTQSGQLAFTADPAKYSIQFGLTHRNGDETEVGCVYEVAEDFSGNRVFGVKQGTNIMLWDPENPTLTYQQYSNDPRFLYSPGGKFYPQEYDVNRGFIFPRFKPSSSNSRIRGVLYPSEPIDYAVKYTPYKNSQILLTRGEISSTDLDLPVNLYLNQSETISIKFKFFTYTNTATYGFSFKMGKYLGEYTFTIANNRMTQSLIGVSRTNHNKTVLSGNEPPF